MCMQNRSENAVSARWVMAHLVSCHGLVDFSLVPMCTDLQIDVHVVRELPEALGSLLLRRPIHGLAEGKTLCKQFSRLVVQADRHETVMRLLDLALCVGIGANHLLHSQTQPRACPPHILRQHSRVMTHSQHHKVTHWDARCVHTSAQGVGVVIVVHLNSVKECTMPTPLKEAHGARQWQILCRPQMPLRGRRSGERRSIEHFGDGAHLENGSRDDVWSTAVACQCPQATQATQATLQCEPKTSKPPASVTHCTPRTLVRQNLSQFPQRL